MHPIYFFDPLLSTISPVMLSTLGICFLFLLTPENPALDNYRLSRKILAASYFLLAIANIVSGIMDDGLNSNIVDVYSTLIGGAFQAFLITFTLITLINVEFVKRKYIIREVLPFASLSFLLIVFANNDMSIPEKIVYWLLCLYYISMLVRYTILYFKQERLYQEKMGDFFSDTEVKRLDWVRVAFLGALSIGILALVAQWLANRSFFMVFSLLYTLYYLYFAIKYINYAQVFHVIAPAIVPQEDKEKQHHVTSERQIAKYIETWVIRKQFLSPHITVNDLAAEINTNRTYLSAFINTHKQMNFATWVNQLRIEEAKRILLEQPQLSVGKVGQMAGYKEHSNFTRQFTKCVGFSPNEWRKQNTDKK